MKAYNKRKIKYRKCKIIHRYWDFDGMVSKYGFRIEAGEYVVPSMFDYFQPSFYDHITIYHKDTDILGFHPEDLMRYIDTIKALGFNFELAKDYRMTNAV